MKVLRPLLLSLLLVVLLVAFSACGSETTPTPTPGGDTGDVGGGDTPAHTHTPGEWVVDTEAGYGVTGSKHQVCAECGETIATETIPAYAEGLAYEVNDDGVTCTITGMGTCTDTNLNIPPEIDGYIVTVIGEEAFCLCTSLTSIAIPDGVTAIGEWAFSECWSLTNITIPASVTVLGNYAFHECFRLIEVQNLSSLDNIDFDLGDGLSPMRIYSTGESYLTTTSDGYVLYDDGTNVILVNYVGNETELILPSNTTMIWHTAFSCMGCFGEEIGEAIPHSQACQVTSVVIPDGVTHIGLQAFFYCGITNITIPTSVSEIDYGAFQYCTNLTNITYNGTKAEWEAIPKVAEWDYKTNDYVIHCTDGVLPKTIEIVVF